MSCSHVLALIFLMDLTHLNDINNLPSTVLLTGLIQTKGKPVFSITEQVTSLKASMGKITPPHNLLIRKEKNVSKRNP